MFIPDEVFTNELIRLAFLKRLHADPRRVSPIPPFSTLVTRETQSGPPDKPKLFIPERFGNPSSPSKLALSHPSLHVLTVATYNATFFTRN